MGLAPIEPIPPVARPSPPAAPKPRAMDSYDPSVARAFADKETSFFNGAPSMPDTVITLVSDFGSFKVDTYPNPANPADIQYVVFFSNKATQEVFEVHGTIAVFYINDVRNGTKIIDFPISNSRTALSNAKDGMSYFSRYSLRWEQATNKVIRTFYPPYDPAFSTIPARLHDYDPTRKDTLVAYSEEHAFSAPGITYANWKDEAGLGKYSNDIGLRSVGMPTQILLHETAAFGNLSIPNVREERTSKGGIFFPIPHFCVNNQDKDDHGVIIQFVDVAVNVPQGEATNPRSVGIEFVNAPIEAFKTDSDNKVLQPLQAKFDLEHQSGGIYLKTKLAGLPKLFIPLEFSEQAGSSYYELALRKDRLINLATLKAGAGPGKAKVVVEDGENLLIKYAKSDRFEHLAALVSALVDNGLIKGLDDLAREASWLPVFRSGDIRFYLFEHAWRPVDPRDAKNLDVHYFRDFRSPGILTHLFAGSHVDGGLQGLYLYLRLACQVPTEAVLQLMLTFLTSDPTAAEKGKLKLSSVLLMKPDRTVFNVPAPVEREFADILELDAEQIQAAVGS